METVLTNATFVIPEWLNREHYPFESKFLEINDNKVHYIDEGKGDIILFSHPACAWSFMYRDMIKVLSKEFRCIALDYPGFGFSIPSKAYEYTIESQSKILNAFIEKLNLEDLYFLGHDTGGPSGFYIAAQKPELFKGFIFTGTIMFPTNEFKKLHNFIGVLSTWPLKIINQQFNIVVWAMVNKLKAQKVPKDVQQHYFNIFNTKEKRERVRKLLVNLKDSTAIMITIKDAMSSKLSKKPSLLIYGVKDPVNELGIPERAASILSNSELHLIENEGHFPHEGNGERMALIIKDWLLGKNQ
ncbi:alpha/beta fold hydrolase [Leptobacterium sp. I13]|uniref:alpha/beta fold hydrolase n=1 Tax=Leptobacterium meishanense TaxID=3128904 RepID=UPI0030EC5FDC